MRLLTRSVSTGLIAAAFLFFPGVGMALEKHEVLTWGENSPASVDPAAARGVSGTFGRLNLYDSLYRYMDNPPKLIPWLAKSHTVSKDGITWEFTLRSGIKFHDGSEMTADDVVYSFNRLLALKKNPSGAFRPILKPTNITAIGKYTIKFVLNKPYAPFLAAMPLVGIVNPRVVKQHEKKGDLGAAWMASNDAGSGPYKVVPGSFIAYKKVSMEWFPDHFMGWHKNPVKRVNVQFVKETSTRMLALMKGEIDATDSRIPADHAKRLEKAPGVKLRRDKTMRLFMITMHNQRPPLNNIHVRKALSYAFNYKGFISDVMKDEVVRNPAPIPNNLWGYPKGLKGYDYNLEKAKAELDLAKKAGVDLSRTLKINNNGSRMGIVAGQLWQGDLRKIGIKLEIVNSFFPNNASNARRKETTADLWAHWLSAYFVDPENWIGQMYDSQFHGTWKASAWYKNPEVDKLLRKARSINDQDQRAGLYEKAAHLVVDDAVDIWIFNSVELRGLRDRVKGFQYCPVGGGADFRTISLTK